MKTYRINRVAPLIVAPTQIQRLKADGDDTRLLIEYAKRDMLAFEKGTR